MRDLKNIGDSQITKMHKRRNKPDLFAMAIVLLTFYSLLHDGRVLPPCRLINLFVSFLHRVSCRCFLKPFRSSVLNLEPVPDKREVLI